MFGDLANSAGFQPVQASRTDSDSVIPLELWRSDFAIIALVRIREATPEAMEHGFRDASDRIDQILRSEEGNNYPLDGYLLFVMPSTPNDELIAHAHRIEADTSVCRKHVLWPDADGSWSSTLNAITTLGLPPAAPASASMMEPQLPWVAKIALEARDNDSSYVDVATQLETMPPHESEGDVNAN